MSDYNIFSYGAMMADDIRMSAYRAALEHSIRPGSVVLDIGAGQGIFSLVACRLGASRVFAIELNDVIHVARAVAKANGFADRITFIQEDSRNVQLPEAADVLVSDLRGVLPILGDHFGTIADARERLLKPGGAQIPLLDTLFAAVAAAPSDRDSYLGGFTAHNLGFDFSRATIAATSLPWKVQLEPSQLLSSPAQLATFDYTAIHTLEIETQLNFSINNAASADGILLWFDAVLLSGIGFSTAPGNKTVYGQGMLPWPQSVALQPHDQVNVTIVVKLFDEKAVWSWKTTITRGNDRIYSFDQSSLPSQIHSAARLRDLARKL